MFLISGLFMLSSSLLTDIALKSYSNTYVALDYKDKHETIGHVNCFLYQLYIIYMCLSSTTADEYTQASYLFASFMFFDMIHYIFYIRRISSYLHHIITILCVVYVNSEYASIDTLVIFNHLLILFESTNPPMSISWIGNKFGYKDYILYKILGTFTFLYWTFIRIIYLSYYIYNTPNFNNQITMIPFLILNLFWFKSLVQVYLKVIFKLTKNNNLKN